MPCTQLLPSPVLLVHQLDWKHPLCNAGLQSASMSPFWSQTGLTQERCHPGASADLESLHVHVQTHPMSGLHQCAASDQGVNLNASCTLMHYFCYAGAEQQDCKSTALTRGIHSVLLISLEAGRAGRARRWSERSPMQAVTGRMCGHLVVAQTHTQHNQYTFASAGLPYRVRQDPGFPFAGLFA